MIRWWSDGGRYAKSKMSALRHSYSKRCKNIDLGAWADEDYRVTMIDQEDFLLELQQVE